MKYQFVVLALAGVFASWIATVQTGKAAATPPAVSVPQFEYCQYFDNYYSPTLLNNMGREGWELVSFNTIGETQVTDRWQAKGFAMTFKRPLGSGMKSCTDSEK